MQIFQRLGLAYDRVQRDKATEDGVWGICNPEDGTCENIDEYKAREEFAKSGVDSIKIDERLLKMIIRDFKNSM